MTLQYSNLRLAGSLYQILEKNTSLFVELLANSKHRWISSAIVLPLQRVHIIALQGFCRIFLFQPKLWQLILNYVKLFSEGQIWLSFCVPCFNWSIGSN